MTFRDAIAASPVRQATRMEQGTEYRCFGPDGYLEAHRGTRIWPIKHQGALRLEAATDWSPVER